MVLVYLALLSLYVNAQSELRFERVQGTAQHERGYSIVQSPDSGYVLFGSTNVLGTSDLLLVKLDANGSIQWSRVFGGISGDYGHQIRPTSDGGYIGAGWGRSFGVGSDAVYLVKLSETGSVQWLKSFGGSLQDRGYSVCQQNDGGYVVAGRTTSFESSIFDNMYIIRTDSNGDTLWTRVYGEFGIQRSSWIENTSDGGLITTGNITLGFGFGFGNMMLIKLNSAGDALWTKSFGGVAGQSWGNCVKQISTGGYIAVGYTEAFGAGGRDVYVVRCDSVGSVLWSRTYGGNGDDEGQSIIEGDNGFVIGGTTKSFGPNSGQEENGYMIGIDWNGDTLWTLAIGGPEEDIIYSVEQGVSEGFVFAGLTQSLSVGTQDLYINKIGDLGEACNSSATPTIVGTPNTHVDTTSLTIIQNDTEVNSFGLSAPPLILADNTICFEFISSTNEMSDLGSGMNIYPNPSNGQFFVDIPQGQQAESELSIFELTGREVFRKRIQIGENHIYMDLNLDSGVYIIVFRNSVSQTGRKIIVTNEG